MGISKSSVNVNITNDLIVNMVDTHIKSVISKRYEALKKDFLEQLERDKAKELAGITVYLMNQVDIQSMNDRVILTLRTQND